MKQINWGPSLFLVIYQIGLLISLPFYFYYETPSLALIMISIALFFATGFGITAGYHRLFSHRSFKSTKVFDAIALFFGTMGCQGSALRWCFDHRLHHAHVDTDADPYSINKGFWYAHFLWIFERQLPIDPKVVPDLMKNPLIMFQHNYYGTLMVATNVIAWAFVGWMLDDYLGAFMIAVLARMFFLHHCTWFINSLAHTWGDKPFCQEQTAVNNAVIALLTFGEGYHNFHHTFANDYRNGIRWYHFDPTKWLIWTTSKLGLVSGLKTVDAVTIKKRLVMERKNLLLERLCNLWYVKKDELENGIKDLSDRLLAEFAELNSLKEKYYALRKECNEKEILDEVKRQIKKLRKQIRQDWTLWVQLSRNILKLKPLQVC